MGTVSLDRIEEADALDARERGVFRTVNGPLVLVCTHGRRDPCCAERGRPLANATAAVFPAETWESTHVGGDRFAANMVVFPHGLYFGHLEAVRGPEVVETYRDGRIVLERFRGRCAVPMPAQAAEHHVRSLLGLDGIDDVIPFRTVAGSDEVVVSLRVSPGGSAAGGSVYVVRIRPDLAAPMRLTCHAGTEGAPHRWLVEGVDPLTSR